MDVDNEINKMYEEAKKEYEKKYPPRLVDSKKNKQISFIMGIALLVFVIIILIILIF